ncbi:adenosine tri phosphatase [Perkinsus sp. BL_2016]|nr:adenosine tri phosphatase [Perkinsus sp. BL_2016]
MGIPDLDIDGLVVAFPFDAIYPEQIRYMHHLKRTLDERGQGLLEMPTGTGKTVAVFSLMLAYQDKYPDQTGKLVFCTRTVPEMTKALRELRAIVEYRQSLTGHQPFLAVGVSARKNMCVHPTVSRQGTADAINAKCRLLTSKRLGLSTDMEDSDGGSGGCQYFTRYEEMKNSGVKLRSGVYTVEDLKAIGLEEGWCPYFYSRRMLAEANVVVFSYQYVLDAGVAASTPLFSSSPVGSESVPAALVGSKKEPGVVVFDEAHNIDDVCIESMTVKLNRHSLDAANSNLKRLSREVQSARQKDASRLKEEYDRLVQGLVASGDIDADVASRIPVPTAIPTEGELGRLLVPGSVRKAENFLSLLQAVLGFMKQHIIGQKSRSEGTLMFCHRIEESQNIDSKTLKSFSLRLRSLLNTLKIVDVDQFVPIAKVCEIVSLAASHSRGFAVLVDPYPEMEGVYDPQLELSCLDASIAMKLVTDRFETVVLTSGTLSPLSIYPKLLDLNRVVTSEHLKVSLSRECIRPMVVTRANDQTLLSSKFDLRNDADVIKGYGQLLEELSQTVPDGLVGFFTSKMYIRNVVQIWFEAGILTRLSQQRPVFFETEDVVETTVALANFRNACDQGRGAIFLAVARGKVSEGIDFDRHYGRCVVLFGVPYQFTLSRRLRARLEYLKDRHGIEEQEFLTFDAMRAASQCVGRVIRSKMDYGIMVFADYRYAKADKRGKLPEWIQKFLVPSLSNLTVDMATASAREFLLHMSQPFSEVIGGKNPSKLSKNDIVAWSRKHMPSIQPKHSASEDVIML